MKITGVHTTLFAGATPAPKSLANATAKAAAKIGAPQPPAFCLVELKTDEGLSGISISPASAQSDIHQLTKDVLNGENPSSVTGLWEAMGSGKQQARAALDVALWDLKAKANDEPLWQSLGGLPPRAKAFASWRGDPADLNAMQAWFARLARDHGITGGCVPLGEKSEWSVGGGAADPIASGLKALHGLREALRSASHQPELMIDAGEHWLPGETIRKVRAFEAEFDITCVRGGVSDGDFLGSKRLIDSIYGAVAAGRNLPDCEAYLPWFQHHAANIIEIDIRNLGITGALQVADAAFGFELPVLLCAAPGNMHAHLATVMPNFMAMEVVDPTTVVEPSVGGRMIAGDVTFADGRGYCGNARGNGLNANLELLARHAPSAANPEAGA